VRVVSPPPSSRLLTRLLVVGAGVATGGVFGLALVVSLFGRRSRPLPAEALVVLGAKVLPGGVPSQALVARVETAVALWHRGVAPLLVFSGGGPPGEPTEARVSLRLAQAAGVPPAACVLEEVSRTTAGNARETVRLLQARGLSRVLVVSDDFHLLRARQLFRREGLEVGTWPATREGRRLTPLDRLYWVCREAFGLLFQPRVLLARPRPSR
jgi:uncharacterized SAM-binding protein YcdF (DUF218 family)